MITSRMSRLSVTSHRPSSSSCSARESRRASRASSLCFARETRLLRPRERESMSAHSRARLSPVPARCAVHPARPALDDCPVCGRPRCPVDASTYGATGCGACRAATQSRATVGLLPYAVRAGLAGIAVALVGGWIATQYVGVHLMSLVAPAVVGLAASWAVGAAARRQTSRLLVLALAAVAAVLGTALGFRLTPGGQSPLHPAGEVGAPYLAALVGVVAWPLLLEPRRGGKRESERSARAGGAQGVDGTD